MCLDEPSIGLHQRDNIRLLNTLGHLRDIGNTLIVVEHDAETIASADWLVDLGPGAGHLGGQRGGPRHSLMRCGPTTRIHSPAATSVRPSSGSTIPSRSQAAGKDAGNRWIVIKKARENNLAGIDRPKLPAGPFNRCDRGLRGGKIDPDQPDSLHPALARRLHGIVR